MTHAPSSSPLTSGRRRWLACEPQPPSCIVAAGRTVAVWPEPRRLAIDSRTISRSSCSFIYADRVDDADDRGVYRRALPAQRLAGRAPFEDDEHFLVHAGANPVHREQRIAARGVVDVQRLHEEQLGALELAVLLRRHDRADHAANLH